MYGGEEVNLYELSRNGNLIKIYRGKGQYKDGMTDLKKTLDCCEC